VLLFSSLLSVVLVTLVVNKFQYSEYCCWCVETASGCASLEASDETRVTHSDDGRLAYVECVNSRHSWRLHCAGNVWKHVDPDVSIASCIDPTPALDDNGGQWIYPSVAVLAQHAQGRPGGGGGLSKQTNIIIFIIRRCTETRINSRQIVKPPPPRPLITVPNVTAHPSTASISITVFVYNGPLLCGFNMSILFILAVRVYAVVWSEYSVCYADSAGIVANGKQRTSYGQ